MVIKVCGMRDGRNIRETERLKPTMMGFICWDGSSRYVDGTPDYLPQCIRVGVFVNPSLGFVKEKVKQLGLTRIQLHGNETPHFCQKLIMETGLPIMKAISVRRSEDIDQYNMYEGICDLLLFDTKSKSVGGSGEQFDWDILQRYHGSIPFMLAGGIGPDDAERVKDFCHPMFLGIDVNSRFETKNHLKDIAKLSNFINKIRA